MSEHVDAHFVEEKAEAGSALAVQAAQPIAQAPSGFFDTMRPKERVALATEIADSLKDVLDKKQLIKKIPGKNGTYTEHVELEGWQFLGSMCNVSAKIEATTRLEDGSYTASAVVVRVDTGIVVGRGESMCSKSEKRWSYADEYAVKSMAQTRAMSRALRGVLSWVLVLAGYSPTPADEMPPGGFHEQPAFTQAPAPKPKPEPNVPVAELKALYDKAAAAGKVSEPALGGWLVREFAHEGFRPGMSLTPHQSQQAKAKLQQIVHNPAA